MGIGFLGDRWLGKKEGVFLDGFRRFRWVGGRDEENISSWVRDRFRVYSFLVYGEGRVEREVGIVEVRVIWRKEIDWGVFGV